MGRESAAEQVAQLCREPQVTVDDDGELLEVVLDVHLSSLDRHGDVAQLACWATANIPHHAEADERHRDGLVAGIARSRQPATHDDVQRLIEIVDDEDDVGETAVMPAELLGDDGLGGTVGAQCLGGLAVELVTGGTHDDTVDAAEPHATGVDGSDEYLSRDSGDVTIDDANLHDSS